MCVPSSTLYEIMTKQTKGFLDAAFFIFLVLLISVSLRLDMGSGHYQLIKDFFCLCEIMCMGFLFVLVQVSKGMKLYNNFSYRLGP